MTTVMKQFFCGEGFKTSGHGMDLRDYFAAKAMQGLLATTKEEQWFPDEVAGISYEVADAMIKARKE